MLWYQFIYLPLHVTGYVMTCWINYWFQWDSHYIYLIMEYCCGGDLSHFIRSHRTLSEYMAKRLLQQIGMYMRFQGNFHYLPFTVPRISLGRPVK